MDNNTPDQWIKNLVEEYIKENLKIEVNRGSVFENYITISLFLNNKKISSAGCSVYTRDHPNDY